MSWKVNDKSESVQHLYCKVCDIEWIWRDPPEEMPVPCGCGSWNYTMMSMSLGPRKFAQEREEDSHKPLPKRSWFSRMFS